jgi:hypothetical protein
LLLQWKCAQARGKIKTGDCTMLYLLSGALCLVLFCALLHREPRNFLNVIVLLAAAILLFIGFAETTKHLDYINEFFYAFVFGLVPLVLLVIAVLLIINGFYMLKKEGRRLPNLLSLFAGFAIIAGMIVIVALTVTSTLNTGISVFRQDQLFIHHVHHQLERAAAAGLLQQVFDVVFHRVGGDAQSLGDLLVFAGPGSAPAAPPAPAPSGRGCWRCPRGRPASPPARRPRPHDPAAHVQQVRVSVFLVPEAVAAAVLGLLQETSAPAWRS